MARPALILSVLLLAPAVGATGPQEKSVKKLVKLVRYERDAKALKLLSGEDQGKRLLQGHWAKASPAERKRFTRNFQGLFAALAFPKVRKNFEHLKSIVCSKAKVEGRMVDLPCNVVLMHALKKKEMKVVFRLTQKKGWKIVDVKVMGDWMLEGIREQQIQPLMKRGGWNSLLEKMETRLAKVTVSK
ncbi:MAG: hypothetical protein CMH50_00445 [Myxococcales bacterium]|mgnify:FL=1|nr:hypothetical protein [Myxococcales bacterium]